MHEGSRFAYVTLCASPEFLPGVRCLSRSLVQTGTDLPLICLVPPELESTAQAHLAGERLQVLGVEPLTLSPQFVARHTNSAIETVQPMTRGTKPEFHSKLLNFLKLRAWQLTQFDKVVFLDADVVVIRSIDQLFDYPAFCAAPNLYASLADFHRINSGVFVLAPSQRLFERMLHALDAPYAFWPRTDQTFLESFFKRDGLCALGLPYFFNVLQYVWFNLPELWSWQNTRVIHYQFEKPWDEASFQSNEKSRIRRRLLAPLVDLWHAVDSAQSCLPQVDNRAYLRSLQPDLDRLRAIVDPPAQRRITGMRWKYRCSQSQTDIRH